MYQIPQNYVNGCCFHNGCIFHSSTLNNADKRPFEKGFNKYWTTVAGNSGWNSLTDGRGVISATANQWRDWTQCMHTVRLPVTKWQPWRAALFDLVRVTMSFVLYSEWYGFHTDFRYLGDEYCNDKRSPSWGSWTIFKSTISLSSFLSDSASCAFSRRFSLECRKTNAITLTNQNTHNQNTHKQRCEPNQNSEQIYVKRFKCWKTTGLSFICNWLRTWRKFFQPISERSKTNNILDTHLKTALI